MPSSSALRYAQRAEASPRKFIDGVLDCCLDLICVGCQLQNCLRSTLGHKKLISVRSFDRGFCAFMHRIEGLKVKYLEALQLLVVLHSTDHCKVDGVLVFGSRRERGPENNFVGSNAVHGEGIAQRQFVLC